MATNAWKLSQISSHQWTSWNTRSSLNFVWKQENLQWRPEGPSMLLEMAKRCLGQWCLKASEVKRWKDWYLWWWMSHTIARICTFAFFSLFSNLDLNLLTKRFTDLRTHPRHEMCVELKGVYFEKSDRFVCWHHLTSWKYEMLCTSISFKVKYQNQLLFDNYFQIDYH